MEIVVCIKQVPGTTNVEIDPITGVMKRDGIEAKLNPYDLFAIELALLLKEKYGGQVHVMTMGPLQAKKAVLEALYMGADSGSVISDRRFAGSDVIATSYTLSQGIKKLKFDLIICGKQTTDGDTAQVGPETAEFLGISHSTNVISVDEIKNNNITFKMKLDNTIQIQRTKLPCLITVDKDINTPRLPSYIRKRNICEDIINSYCLDDFEDHDEDNYGLKGSATQVERIFAPEKNKDKKIFEGTSEALTKELYNLFKSNKIV